MHELLKTIKSYNKQAEWHSSKFDGYDWSKYLLKFTNLLKGKKILDFGCGNGRDLKLFYKNKFDAIGIDYSDELIKIARKKLKNVKILKRNFLKKLDFKDEEFDGVWACASILHIPKKSLNKVLLEIRRILKKQGILFISVKKGKGEKIVKDDYGDEKRFFSLFKKTELINRLKNLRFRLIKTYKVSDDKLRVRFKKKKNKRDWIILYCQKPPITDGWHACRVANIIQVVLKN